MIPIPDAARVVPDYEDAAVAAEAPMEVFRLDAIQRRDGSGRIDLRGPADHVVVNGRRGVLFRRVALVPVGGAE